MPTLDFLRQNFDNDERYLGDYSTAEITAINTAIATGGFRPRPGTTLANKDVGQMLTLSGIGAAASFIAVSGDGNSGKLLPTEVSSFSGSYGNVDNSANQTTYCQLIMLPAKYSAVRIGWPHMGGNGALTGLRMVVASTEDIGDLTLTNTTGGKRFITPWKNGAEQNALSFDGWKAVTWGGQATGSAADLGTDFIDIAWSDVVPCQALPLASDPTNRFAGWYPLLVRVFPGSGFHTRCSYMGFSDVTKFLAECGPAVVMGANRSAGDHVATLANWTAASTPAFSDSAVMPMVIEAYTTDRASAPSVMLVGDSRFASPPIAESATAYRTLATKIEQAALAGGVKLKLVRAAQGGKTGPVYTQRASKTLDGGIQPNVSVYLGYSINDGSPTDATLAAAKARVLAHVTQCRKADIIPVIVSIFPTGTGGFPSAMPRVNDFEAFCAGLGAPCLSPLAIYGNASTGAWTGAWAEDDNHMTPAGYTDLAARIWALASPLLR